MTGHSDRTPVHGIPIRPRNSTRNPSYRYRVCRELDAGGMATVYLARMEGPGGFEKLVAIKSIHPHLAGKSEIVDMFLDEAQIVAELSHPNVCSVLDFGCVDSTYFIAMEYVFGEHLARLARRVHSLQTRPANWHAYVAYLIAGAAEGLHAAHELRDSAGQLRNVVHRDVTPNNISVGYDGSVRMMDFGIARAEGQVHETRDISLKGKIAYMAPEQFSEDANVDRRSDLWSLGVVLWELLTLKRLFRRSTEPQTALAICEGRVPDPRSVDASIPVELANVAMACLVSDRDQRTATARDVSRAIRGYLAKLGTPMGMPEVAELMSFVFADERRHKQALIDNAKTMENPASLSSLSSAALRFDDLAGGTPGSNSEATLDSEADETVALEPETLRQPPSEQPAARARDSVEYALPKRRTGMALAVGAGIAIAAAAGFLIYQAMQDDDGTTVSANAAQTDTGVAVPAPTQPVPTPTPVTVPEPDPEPETDLEPEPEPETETDTEPEPETEIEADRDAKREARKKAKKREREQRDAEAKAKKAQAELDRKIAADKKREREADNKREREEQRKRDEARKKAEELAEKEKVRKAAEKALRDRKAKQALAKPKALVPFTVRPIVSVSGGGLTKGDVSSAVNRKKSALAACYQNARKSAGKDAFGRVTVRFKVGSNRRAKGTSAKGGRLPGLSSCVRSVMSNVRTRAGSDTGDTQVTVTVKYSAR